MHIIKKLWLKSVRKRYPAPSDTGLCSVYYLGGFPPTYMGVYNLSEVFLLSLRYKHTLIRENIFIVTQECIWLCYQDAYGLLHIQETI